MPGVTRFLLRGYMVNRLYAFLCSWSKIDMSLINRMIAVAIKELGPHAPRFSSKQWRDAVTAILSVINLKIKDDDIFIENGDDVPQRTTGIDFSQIKTAWSSSMMTEAEFFSIYPWGGDTLYNIKYIFGEDANQWPKWATDRYHEFQS